MAIPSDQDFENAARDLVTVSDVANSPNTTTTTRMGDTVPTLAGVTSSLSAASGRGFTNKPDMDAQPGAVENQAARVTEGPDKGLYLWIGGQWTKTKDPLTDFDALTINLDKDYPMKAVARGGTAPSDVHTVWRAGLVGARLEGVEADTAFRLATYGNGVDGHYGVTVYKMPMSDLTNQTLISGYETSPALHFDRATGGIQLRTAVIAEGIRLTLVMDVDKLPADGTIVTSAAPTHNGYNSIISPDCYFLASPIQQDSLSINAGKDFPFTVVARGGTAPQDIHPTFKAAIVGADVDEARDLYFYRVGYFGNGVEVSGVKYYGFSIYRIPANRIGDAYQELINDYQTGFQFIPDRGKGGIQTAEFSCISDPQTRIRISMDVDSLPADGTQINSSNTTNNGYNSIIDPANYRIGDYSQFIEGDCLVDWDAVNGKLIFAYKSGTKWYNVRFQRKSVNNTFTILGFGYDDAYLSVLNNIVPVSAIPLTMRTEAASDWIAPMTFRITSGTPDADTVPIYTGGSHGTDNTIGDPTSTMRMVDIYVDGTRLDQSKNLRKVCKFVDILTQQDVQAWNTVVSNRTALEEYVSFNLSPKGVHVYKRARALFDLEFTADNACQVYMAGMTPLTSNTYLFWGGSQTARTSIVDGVNFNSGPKSAYPNVYGVSVRHPNAGEFSSWTDPYFGKGDRAALSGSEPLYLYEGGKIYPKLATITSPFTVKAGEWYEWRGGYYWGEPTTAANFDTVMQVQDGILAVKPNGQYAVRNENETARKYADEVIAPIETAVRTLDRDTSNIYPDADISNIAFYSGVGISIVASPGGSPNRGVLESILTSDVLSWATETWAVEPGKGYYLGARIGANTGSTSNANLELFVDFFSSNDASTLVRTDRIGAAYDAIGLADRYAKVTVPANSGRARFRLEKAVSATAIRIRFSTPIVRRLVDDSLLADSVIDSSRPLPSEVVSLRVVDNIPSFTGTLAGGDTSNRPTISNFIKYTGTSGVTLQVSTVDGVLARKNMYSIGAVGSTVPKFNVHAVFGRVVGASTKVELGVAWFNADRTAHATAQTIVQSWDNFNIVTVDTEFEVGESTSDAQIKGPSGAKYFIPFIRWTGSGAPGYGRVTIMYLDVTQVTAATPEPPETDLSLTHVSYQSLVPVMFEDDPYYLTDSVSDGTSSPIFADHSPFNSSSFGKATQFNPLTGAVRRRELVNLNNASGEKIVSHQVRITYGNKNTGLTRVEFGIVYFDVVKQFVSEQIVQVRDQADEGTVGVRGGWKSLVFTVGTVGSDAQYTPPAGAVYFAPFVRWAQTVAGEFVFAEMVTTQLPGSGGVATLPAELFDSIAKKAAIPDALRASPVRLTAAQAASLSPYERFMSEWFVVDGDLTHRDDLPAFASQPLTLDQDFPQGDYLTGSVTPDGATVTMRPRVWGSESVPGWYAARLKGAFGKQPQVVITNADQWQVPRTMVMWRLVWGTDPNSDVWNRFDSEIYDEANQQWIFQNDKPFAVDTVYFYRMPMFTFGRYDNMIRHWISTGDVRPTKSAIDGFRVGQLDAIASGMGKSLPTTQHYAFTIGTGAKKFVLTSGIHVDEQPGHYLFEGMVNFLLGPSDQAKLLREYFTFYVYPRINAQGQLAGCYRAEPDTGHNMNRIWGDPAVNCNVTTLYYPIFDADLTDDGGIAGHIDCHSTPRTDPTSGGGIQPSIWCKTGVAEETALEPYRESLAKYTQFRTQPYSGDHLISYYMKKYGTPRLIITAEYLHSPSHGPNEWRAYGANMMRALSDIRSQF